MVWSKLRWNLFKLRLQVCPLPSFIPIIGLSDKSLKYSAKILFFLLLGGSLCSLL